MDSRRAQSARPAPRQPWEVDEPAPVERSIVSMPAWRTVRVGRGALEGATLVSCPVCGALLDHHDTRSLSAHVLYHDRHGEWPWALM